MDPITIAQCVATATARCYSTGRTLYELRQQFKNAPKKINTIYTESKLVAASLAHIQNLILCREDDVDIWAPSSDLVSKLEILLDGGITLFSCLDHDISRIAAKVSDTGRLTWKAKVDFVWNHANLSGYIDDLRGLQLSMQSLIQLLQVDTISEIKQMLQRALEVFTKTSDRTASLRSQHRNLSIAPSTLSGSTGSQHKIVDAVSAYAPSEIEFEFDDLVVDSRVYRRIMAEALWRESSQPVEVVVGDLIDLSDNATLRNAQAPSSSVEDLMCLLNSDTEIPWLGEDTVQATSLIRSTLSGPNEETQQVTVPAAPIVIVPGKKSLQITGLDALAMIPFVETIEKSIGKDFSVQTGIVQTEVTTITSPEVVPIPILRRVEEILDTVVCTSPGPEPQELQQKIEAPQLDNFKNAVSSPAISRHPSSLRGAVGSAKIRRKPGLRVTFNVRVIFYDFDSSSEYDRKGPITTYNRLTPLLAQQIKEELNTMKIEEMEVHPDSKKHTHFF